MGSTVADDFGCTTGADKGDAACPSAAPGGEINVTRLWEHHPKLAKADRLSGRREMQLQDIDVYAPCYCGSGEKYKFCCLKKDRQAQTGGTARTWDDPWRDLGGGRRPIVLDLEEGERLNAEGMRLLDLQRFAEAERSFRAAIAAAPLVPAAHNNLAVVVFNQGRIDEAIHIQETILREVPIENVFGLSNLVQLYLTAGRPGDAEAVAKDAQRMRPRDAGALTKQCEALARLGRHREILNAVERYNGDSHGLVSYYAGMAAANLALFDQALDHLRRVRRGEILGTRAAKYVSLIKAGRGPDTIEGNWPYFEPQDIMPRDVFERLVQEADQGGPAKARLLTNPVVVDMVAAFLNQSRGAGRDSDLVELLGRMDHPRAVDLLKRIAEGTFGSDDLRLSALRTLVNKGVWDSKSPHKMWLRGDWVDVKSQQNEITPEAASVPLPEGLYPLYEAATVAARRGRWEEAEKLWREILAQAPTLHPAYHNLAVALVQQGRKAEAETHLRKAMEIDPSYVFAPCTLSCLYLGEGRVAEARALLDTVILPDTVHPEAMAAYCTTQTQAATAEGDMEKAVGWLDMANKVDPDNPNVRELRKRLRMPRLLERTISKLRRKVEQEKLERRRRVLSEDAQLPDCYGIYSAGELAGMARAIGIGLASSRREDMLAAVCATLGSSEGVAAIRRGLRPEEMTALREVADAGGRMDYETFTRAHGTDADDAPGWSKQPQSLLGRLK
ncbi:MAG: tetratricopeptide repeat protein, partial [Acidobacteria bacterium]